MRKKKSKNPFLPIFILFFMCSFAVFNNTRIKNYKSQNAELKTKVQSLQQKNNGLKSENNKLSNKYKDLKTKIDKLKNI
ncbi:hypothetical protein FDF74_01210 [Clostridium niameyense]|uniref:Uncharacterized protein n=1 Tax=Clostridium niameyense TaxID=1622073 RepID=A0A6M0R6M6_9CLOT|nr:hypothetical protein [Clostridium niameyense]NEZ45825.1 hypothetical protein [Clostridium niameyense]